VLLHLVTPGFALVMSRPLVMSVLSHLVMSLR
jgi:hypothetical protein